MRTSDAERRAFRSTHKLGETEEQYTARAIERLEKETGLRVTADQIEGEGVRLQGWTNEAQLMIDIRRPSIAAAEQPFRAAALYAREKGLYQ